MRDSVKVVFDTSYPPFNSGEVATFAPPKARELIAKGVCHEPGGLREVAAKLKPRPRAQKLEPGTRVKFMIPGLGDAVGNVKKAGPSGPIEVEHDGEVYKVAREGVTFTTQPSARGPEPTAPKPEPAKEESTDGEGGEAEAAARKPRGRSKKRSSKK